MNTGSKSLTTICGKRLEDGMERKDMVRLDFTQLDKLYQGPNFGFG